MIVSQIFMADKIKMKLRDLVEMVKRIYDYFQFLVQEWICLFVDNALA